MSTESRTFWAMWVLANVVGWGLMYMIGFMPYGQLTGMAGAALLLGVLQWLCLSSFLGADYTWIFASVGTYTGFFWLLSLSGANSTLVTLLMVLVGLFALSWLQFFSLNSFVDGAASWPIGSAFSAQFAFVLAFAVVIMLARGSAVLFWATFGAIYGGLTGALLVLLKALTRPSADDSVPPWRRTTSSQPPPQ